LFKKGFHALYKKSCWRLGVLFLSLFSTFAVFSEGESGDIKVGAIRWDAWNEWGHFQQFLNPEPWHYRLPFFANKEKLGKEPFREDVPEVIDQEIDLAVRSGIDFWAFVWYHPEGWDKARLMMRCFDIYLANPKSNNLSFCLILQGGHLGDTGQWDKTVAFLTGLFGDSRYQKVLGTRPLVFLFSIEDAIQRFGGEAEFRRALNVLREKSKASSCKADPYIAGMVFEPQKGARFVSVLGLDAVSAYSNPPYGFKRQEFPYSKQVEINRVFWEECQKLQVPLIPTVNTGWDFRPEANPDISYRNPDADWVTTAKPQEIADHLKGAVAWVKENPQTCEAKAIIIYAWNEFNEGGWLVPTLSEGAARLEAIREVLRPKQLNKVDKVGSGLVPHQQER